MMYPPPSINVLPCDVIWMGDCVPVMQSRAVRHFYLEEISSRSSPVPRAPFGRLRGIASKGQTGSTFENPTDGPEDGVHFTTQHSVLGWWLAFAGRASHP